MTTLPKPMHSNMDEDPSATELQDSGHNPNSMTEVHPETAPPRHHAVLVYLRNAKQTAIYSFERAPNARMKLPLHRDLKAYHSQLIALGSAIGTGLFIGSGQGLATAGPVPLVLAFAFVGFTLCPTVFALGEMATFMPFPGGYIEHARIFVDDAWGAAVGWKRVNL